VTEVIVAVATVLPVAMVIVPLIEATTAPVLLSPVLLPVAEGVAEGVDVGVPVLAAPLAHEATLGRVTSALYKNCLSVSYKRVYQSSKEVQSIRSTYT
jgi:hypothetical protein